MSLLVERQNFIINEIPDNCNSLLDIGCSDGKLLKKLLEVKNIPILEGIDKDSKQYRKAVNKTAETNIKIYNISFQEFNPNYYEVVACSELLEHLNLDENLQLVRLVFEKIKPQKVIFTTPNIDYNHNYDVLVNGLRHSSHKFEFNSIDLKFWADLIIKKYNKYEYSHGYCDELGSSQYLIFRRMK